MPRKPKSPQAALAAVDRYEAAQRTEPPPTATPDTLSTAEPNCDQSDSARTRVNPMRETLKALNRAAYNDARDENGMVSREAYEQGVATAKATLADRIDTEIEEALKHAAGVRYDASYSESIGAVVKLVPTARLLREQSTSITSNVSPAEARQTMTDIMQEAIAAYNALSDEQKAELARRAQPMEGVFLPERRAEVEEEAE